MIYAWHCAKKETSLEWYLYKYPSHIFANYPYDYGYIVIKIWMGGIIQIIYMEQICDILYNATLAVVYVQVDAIILSIIMPLMIIYKQFF